MAGRPVTDGQGQPVAIRPATAADAGPLARLAGQLGYSTSQDDVTRRLAGLSAAPGHAVLLAILDDGTVAGWLHLHLHEGLLDERMAEVGGLVVEAEYRNRGIGQRLMDAAEGWAREHGCRGLTVRSNVIRHDAHRFYERLGFETIKSQRVLSRRFGTAEEGEL